MIEVVQDWEIEAETKDDWWLSACYSECVSELRRGMYPCSFLLFGFYRIQAFKIGEGVRFDNIIYDGNSDGFL